MSEHRGHGQHEIEDIGDMVNYISNLPDCILHQILSFMPTKEAVKTSVLSTRWKYHCPVLEELVLSDCWWMKLNNIVISNSALKSLTIRDRSCVITIVDPSCCKIKIDAANLTYLEYSGFLPNEIILCNTSSLEKSFINIWNRKRLEEVTCRAIDLLEQLKYVVSLRISDDTMETLSFADSKRFPVFPNLTHLMLTMEIGMNRTFRVLMRLLSLCPVLQSISFSEGFMRDMHLGENDLIWSSIPTCIDTLNNFRGYKSEVCFLKWVLKYARVLERMDIWWSETCLQGLKKKRKVKKELERTEKKAASCVIKFS